MEAGAEITAEIIGGKIIISAKEPESMKIAYNLTDERREALVEALSQHSGEKPAY